MKTEFTLATAFLFTGKNIFTKRRISLSAFLWSMLTFYTINSNGQGTTIYGTSALAKNNGVYNSAFGYFSMYNNTSGNRNTATGYRSLYSNQSGSYNTAIGKQSLYSNTTASYNTAVGYESLLYNTIGSSNTALGYSSMVNNTQGYGNTASGGYSLQFNTTGFNNTASGIYSMNYNTTGSYNTASGRYALFSNTTAFSNTATGNSSLQSNTVGSGNTATGAYSLYRNTTGYSNTAIGSNALPGNTTGTHNTAIGVLSLNNNGTGTHNTAIGFNASVSTGNLTNATAIGYNAVVNASNKVRIGNTSVTSIGGQVGWSTFSDGRYKKDIKENVQGLAFINSLRPITYTVNVKGLNEYYNKGKKQVSANGISANKDEGVNEVLSNEDKAAGEEIKKGEDAAGKIVYNGFVAQEVEEAAKKLNYEFSGVDKPESKDGLYGLRYDNFIVSLVKAVQELSKQNEDLQKQINELKAIKSGSAKNNASSSIKATLTDASIEQNVPNPFAGLTKIHYKLPQKFTTAMIIITDQAGKVLKQVNISGIGEGTLNIDAATLSPAAYSYSLMIDGHLIGTKKMVLVR